jgi:hypothetical protein
LTICPDSLYGVQVIGKGAVMQTQHPQNPDVDWSLVAMLAIVISSTAFLLTQLI